MISLARNRSLRSVSASASWNQGCSRQIRTDDVEQPVDVGFALGRQRHELGERVALLHRLQPGRQLGAALDRVELVGDEDARLAGRHQRQHLGVVVAEAPGFDDEQHHVDVAENALHGAVQRAVERGRVPGLEAGRVDEDELRLVERADAGDAVPRRLRLVAR